MYLSSKYLQKFHEIFWKGRALHCLGAGQIKLDFDGDSDFSVHRIPEFIFFAVKNKRKLTFCSVSTE